jgi:hypothetical protein
MNYLKSKFLTNLAHPSSLNPASEGIGTFEDEGKTLKPETNRLAN